MSRTAGRKCLPRPISAQNFAGRSSLKELGYHRRRAATLTAVAAPSPGRTSISLLSQFGGPDPRGSGPVAEGQGSVASTPSVRQWGMGDCIVKKLAVAPYCRSGPVGRKRPSCGLVQPLSDELLIGAPVAAQVAAL